MPLTETERLWRTLHLKDGRLLDKHPVAVFIKSWFCRVISDSGMWTSEGEGDIQRNRSTIPTPFIYVGGTIMDMEEMHALLRESNHECSESLGHLQEATNKIRAFRDVLSPELQNSIRQIRESRMATEMEMKQTLEWLKVVREFFLEKSYEKEMERLREFVAMCKEIKKLKDDGTLDAVADLALKLAGG